MSKGFIPEKLGERCKPVPDNIGGTIALGGCYGSNVATFLYDAWFKVKLVNKGLRHI